MKVVTFIIPPHLKFKDYVDPPKQHKEVRKKDGKRYGNLITDMPLGPLALSAFLKEKIGIQIKLLDFNVELNNLNEFNYKSFYEYFLEYFKNNSHYNDSDVFGISCLYSPSYQSMIDISKVLKKIFNNCTIMAGGNIPSTMYKTIYKKDDSIDLICYGEAEIPMLEYFSSKNPKQYVEQSNSWVTKDKLNNSNFKPQHNFIQNLDEIPIYDYGLCEDKYFKNPAFTAYGKHQETSANFHMLTSRGCPFFCIFCASHKVHGRKMRYYSIDRVKADLLHLKEKHNLKTLIFQDDHFMGDKKRALEIVKFVGTLGVKIIFQNSLALYALNREFLEACRNAGMEQLVLSVESGSERVLKEVMKKPLKLNIIAQVVRDCRDLGIYTYCNIVFGLPGETKKDIEDTRKFLKTTYANWFGIFCANPLVGSEMFDICVDNDYLQNNWIGSDYKQAVVSTEDWSSNYIQQKVYELNLELNFVFNSDYRMGNYEMALDGFERVLRAKKDHAIAYFMASKCLYNLDKKEKAKDYQIKSQEIYSSDKYWMQYMKKFNLNPFINLETIPKNFDRSQPILSDHNNDLKTL